MPKPLLSPIVIDHHQISPCVINVYDNQRVLRINGMIKQDGFSLTSLSTFIRNMW